MFVNTLNVANTIAETLFCFVFWWGWGWGGGLFFFIAKKARSMYAFCDLL